MSSIKTVLNRISVLAKEHSQSIVLMIFGLSVVAALLLSVVLAPPAAEQGEAIPTIPSEEVVIGEAVIAPEAHAFGDLVTATVTLVIDTTAVDPDTITMEFISFDSYEEVAEMERTATQYGNVTIVTYSASLRCMVLDCLEQDGSIRTRPIGSLWFSYNFWPTAEEEWYDASPRRGEIRLSWNGVAMFSRVDPETLASYVFQDDTTPREVEPETAQGTVVLALLGGFLLIAFALAKTIDPNIRLLPERVDPKEFIAEQQEAAAAAEQNRPLTEKVHGQVGAVRAREWLSEMSLYELRELLLELGLEEFAQRAERLHFGPGHTKVEQEAFLRELEALNVEKEADNA